MTEPTHKPVDATESDAPPAEAAQRVSTVIGDRFCINCAYNLTGQSVLREPHYGLLIVRCPECGQVTTTQEYPLLGRWANRLAMIAAAGYLLLAIVFMLGSAAAMLGPTGGMTSGPVEEFRDWMRDDIGAWHAAAYPDQPALSTWRVGDQLRQEWLVVRGGTTGLLAHGGGLFKIVSPLWLLLYAIPMLIALITGIIAATMFAHRSRLSLVGISLVWLCLFAVIVFLIDRAFRSDTSPGFYELAWIQIGTPIYAVMMTVEWLLIIAGMMIGRPVARGVIRAFLPPRLRSAFGWLWLTDGKPLPT